MATLKRIYLAGFRSAETFVSKSNLPESGYAARWDGWNLQTFVPDPNAYTHGRGSFDRNSGLWGFTYTFEPNRKGHWAVKVPA